MDRRSDASALSADIIEKISQFEALFRALTGVELEERELVPLEFPKGANAYELVEDNLRRLEKILLRLGKRDTWPPPHIQKARGERRVRASTSNRSSRALPPDELQRLALLNDRITQCLEVVEERRTPASPTRPRAHPLRRANDPRESGVYYLPQLLGTEPKGT